MIQISYAIGIARPVGIYVNTHVTAKVNLTDVEIAEKVNEIFNLCPRVIEEHLKSCNPIYVYGTPTENRKKSVYFKLLDS